MRQKALGDPVSGEGLIPGLHMASSSLCSPGKEQRQEARSPCVFLLGHQSQVKEPHSHNLISPKAPSSNTNALRVRISTYEFGVKEGNINIQPHNNVHCLLSVFFSAEGVILMCLLTNRLCSKQPH